MRARSRGALVAMAALLALADPAHGQTPPPQPTPFVERVEVNVRTILVRMTDKKGRPPSPPLGPEEIEVVEDGIRMHVLGVDPIRSPAPEPVRASGEKVAVEPPAHEESPAPPAIGIPQHLYVDTTLLDVGSVARIAAEFEKSLSIIVANGPLEIIAADPQPRQILASTRDPEEIRRGLKELARTASGKQLLALQRRQTMDLIRNSVCINPQIIRSAAEQELRIIQDSLDRLVRWAVSLGGQRPDVVYFCADGFDSDVSETYRQAFLERTATGQNTLCAGLGDPLQASQELQSQFAPRGGLLVSETARTLAALDVQTVALALGGNFKDFGTDASVAGHDGYMSRTGVVPLFARPIEPLRTLAEETGGEVVTSVAHLSAALATYDTAFVVSFQSDHKPDGKVHDLRVTSKRPDISIKSPKYAAEAPPEAVGRAAAIRALHEPAAPGGLAVKLAIDDVAPAEGKRTSGVLHVDVDLGALASTLATLGGGRMRVTIAVEVLGAKEPFTSSQEFDVPPNQAGWGADIPISWPAKTQTVAVTVEELKTGTRGTGAVDVPK